MKWAWTDTDFGRQFWYWDNSREEWIKDKFLTWDEVKASKALDFLKNCATL